MIKNFKNKNPFHKYTLFFYQNLLYKNIEAEICEILRINPRLRF